MSITHTLQIRLLILSLSTLLPFQHSRQLDDNLIGLKEPQISVLLVSHYDCSKQYNLRQSGLKRPFFMLKAFLHEKKNRVFADIFVRAKA